MDTPSPSFAFFVQLSYAAAVLLLGALVLHSMWRCRASRKRLSRMTDV